MKLRFRSTRCTRAVRVVTTGNRETEIETPLIGKAGKTRMEGNETISLTTANVVCVSLG